MEKRMVTFECEKCGKKHTIELTRDPFKCPGCGTLYQFPKTDKENEQRRAFMDIFNMPLGEE
jgi:rubrerythrin